MRRRAAALLLVVLLAAPLATQAAPGTGVPDAECPTEGIRWSRVLPAEDPWTLRGPRAVASEDGATLWVAGGRTSLGGSEPPGLALASFDAATGRTRWERLDDAGARVLAIERDGDVLLLAGATEPAGADPGRFVAAYDLLGERLWRVEDAGPAGATFHASFDPTLGVVILVGQVEGASASERAGYAWAVGSEDGRTLWRHTWSRAGESAYAYRSALDPSTGLAYVTLDSWGPAQTTGHLRAFSAATGEVLWTLGDAAQRAAIGAAPGVVYVDETLGSSQSIAAYSSAGALLWRTLLSADDDGFARAIRAADGRVFVASEMAAPARLDVRALDAATGAALWQFSREDAGGGLFAVDVLPVHGGRVAAIAHLSDGSWAFVREAEDGSAVWSARQPDWRTFVVAAIEASGGDLVFASDGGEWRIARLTGRGLAPCVSVVSGPAGGEVTFSWTPREPGGVRIYAGPSADALVLVDEREGGPGSYTKTGLADGETWWFAAASVVAGEEHEASAPIAARAPALPRPPLAPVASTGGRTGEIVLEWLGVEAADDPAARIVVTRDGSRIAELAATERAYLDAGLVPGASHAYTLHVEAVVGAGPRSDTLHATARGLPSPPEGVRAEPGATAGTIALDWDGADTGGDASARLLVRRDGAVVAELPADARSYLDGGLGPRTSHVYTLATSNFAGEGDRSAEVAATAAAAPAAPREVSAQPGPAALAEVRVVWAAPADAGTAPILAYHVYVRDADGPIARATLGPEAREWIHPAVAAHAYTYTVTATNAVGEGDPSAPVCARASPWRAELGDGCIVAAP